MVVPCREMYHLVIMKQLYEENMTTFFLLLQESLDNINLFSIITIMSFCLLAPATFFVEGIKVTPSYLQSAVSTSLKNANSCLIVHIDI